MPSFSDDPEYLLDLTAEHALLDGREDLAVLLGDAEGELVPQGYDCDQELFDLQVTVPRPTFAAIWQVIEEHQKALTAYAQRATRAAVDGRVRLVRVVPTMADPLPRGRLRTATPGEYLRLFMSYRSDHKGAITALARELRAYGIRPFVAHLSIRHGMDWVACIESALAECDALLAVHTPGYHESSFCMQELGHAFGRGIPVIAVHAGEAPHGLGAKRQAIIENAVGLPKLAPSIVGELHADKRTRDRFFNGAANALRRTVDPAARRRMATRLQEFSGWTPALHAAYRDCVVGVGSPMEVSGARDTSSTPTTSQANKLQSSRYIA